MCASNEVFPVRPFAWMLALSLAAPAVVVLSPRVCEAQPSAADRQEARRHFEAAVAAYAQHDFEHEATDYIKTSAGLAVEGEDHEEGGETPPAGETPAADETPAEGTTPEEATTPEAH